MSDLLFRIPPNGTDLVFGRDGPPEGFVGHIALAGALPPITATAQTAIAYGAQLAAVLPGPTATTRLEYRSETSRPIVGTAADAAQLAVPAVGRATDAATLAQGLARACHVLGRQGQGRAADHTARFQDARRAPRAIHSTFEQAVPRAAHLPVRFQDAIATRRATAFRFQDATRAARSTASRFQDAYRDRRLAIASRAQLGQPGVTRLAHATNVGKPAQARRDSRFREAMQPISGRRPPVVIPPDGGYVPDVNLLFCLLPPGPHLVFGRKCGSTTNTIRVPTLRTYIVINTAGLTRVSNATPIPVFGLTVSIDADSAHWTWSASVPLRSLADLEPDAPGQAVELRAQVNGETWNLLLLSVRESERFGAASLQIGGRGIAAELSAPIFPAGSRTNDADATAQQLATAALTLNGAPLGWTLDWQCADWLVPAGVWMHNGTPLDAVVRIAEAAGAYVQAHPSARTLRVLPRYPTAPWSWASAAADIVLPAAAVLERGVEHITRAGYNVVYVSGEAGGILGRVWRDGTAADQPAQMITDALITHPDAARGRGLAVLGNTGAQQLITLETGILPASGVFHVGKMLDWTRGAAARRGIVRGVSVAASVPSGASKAPVVVRQTVEVESHG